MVDATCVFARQGVHCQHPSTKSDRQHSFQQVRNSRPTYVDLATAACSLRGVASAGTTPSPCPTHISQLIIESQPLYLARYAGAVSTAMLRNKITQVQQAADVPQWGQCCCRRSE